MRKNCLSGLLIISYEVYLIFRIQNFTLGNIEKLKIRIYLNFNRESVLSLVRGLIKALQPGLKCLALSVYYHDNYTVSSWFDTLFKCLFRGQTKHLQMISSC